MGSEGIPGQKSGGDEANLAAEVAALSARVSALEQQLREMREMAAVRIREETAPIPPAEITTAAPTNVGSAAADRAGEVTPPPPPQTIPSFHGTTPPPAVSLESRLGAQVFNRVGIVALLIGATWFLKLAVDNHWIGPVGRIVVGLVAGAGLVVWSERFRRKGFEGFSYSLKAIGTGVLYLSLWAAFQLYHLLPAGAALAGMIVVTAWNAYMAWTQDAELLAAYALAGGLATPLLLSTGGNHQVFLFSYLLALDAMTVLLVRLKPWHRLPLGAFPATVVYFIGWYVQFFTAAELGITAVFIVLFSAVFASVPIHREEGRARRGLGYVTTEILLPFWNAGFVSLAMYSVLRDSGHHALLPWLMVALGAVYLGLMRLPQSEVAAAMHLSIAVVSLTIAIPLKASGHWITVGWLVEGLALAWVATRVTATAASPARVLRWLSAGAFVLGLCGLISAGYWFDASVQRPLFNSDFSAALIAIAMLSGAGWLAFRAQRTDPSWTRYAIACLLAIQLVGLLLCLREIATSRRSIIEHEAFLNADFAMALVGVATIAVVARITYRLSRSDEAHGVFWRQFAGGSIIAINLFAVLTGVREIEALWPISSTAPEAQLQQALAVSAFLMVYGGVLLAVGFWRRTAFIRWQALVLILFTILKTFLYDMRNLSQGYRVVSFLGLGALLMAVSFAYQRDWLGLRDSASGAQTGRDVSQNTGSSQ
jgi:uncharacterized membrane protein